jgi:hypothetical protein
MVFSRLNREDYLVSRQDSKWQSRPTAHIYRQYSIIKKVIIVKLPSPHLLIVTSRHRVILPFFLVITAYYYLFEIRC